MKKPLVIGNLKMNMSIRDGLEYVKRFIPFLDNVKEPEVVLAPPFTVIHALSQAIGGKNLQLAAQNMHWEEEGAYTGEISPLLIKEAGCEWVILGHSERRQYFGETYTQVRRKLESAFKHKINPVVCFGETLAVRRAGRTFQMVEDQIDETLKGLKPKQVAVTVLAYEPIWAIGTGKTATPWQANEVHQFIRNKIETLFGKPTAADIRILYGGSVNPENCEALIHEDEIDGFLVGGSSQKEESFQKIISVVEEEWKIKRAKKAKVRGK
ncbi:MAG TPA: triose-phosphate isomerase [Nitrospiria bacterium]|nr:triose-phosphate isomerase [Nitrospiria bacterium]